MDDMALRRPHIYYCLASCQQKNKNESFIHILADLQELSGAFIRDVIMKATSANLMNSLMKSVC